MYPKRLHRSIICTADEPVVQTKHGKLRGLISEGTYIFRGVRYAKAARFKAPEEPDSWDGVQNALVYGPVCCEIITDIAHDAYYVPHFYYPQDENCHYLNVWTQSVDSSAKKPVMVWIHGGGFSTGSSIELFAYDGEELSRYGDVVVVSINHRLNCLGYFDLADFGAEYAHSANAGTLDLVAALKWIKENIASFGGDPDNVTIMGQSGGGGKVAALLQTPAADGLFHKAVIQSGMTARRTHTTHAQASEVAAETLKILGIAPEDVKKIETIPYYRLARAANEAAARLREKGYGGWGPVFDGRDYLGNALSEQGFRRETRNIPLMIGSNLGEFSGNATFAPLPGDKRDWSEADVMALIRDLFGDDSEKAIAAFRSAYPKNELADLPLLDTNFRTGVMVYSQERVKAGSAPVWTYMFSLEMPYKGGTLAWHNAEEAYMFHNAEYLEASYIPGVSEWMQDMMTSAWLSFARTGDPNHNRMPVWEKQTEETDKVMKFDLEPGMVYDHDKELMAIYPNKQFKGLFAGSPLGGGPRQSI